MKKALSLLELNLMVKDVIDETMRGEYWVEAELAEARENGGHCYMELIEKDAQSNTPVARASAKCWRSTWSMVRPHFERVTGQRLARGMKVLLLVYPQFHENYGFSWIVSDIDPTFTLGDMARRRKEIVEALKAEGVFDLNKQLPLPVLTQRIAVVSSQNAAGYGDFRHQLLHNEYRFRFDIELFPAIMQGEGVEASVIAALDMINRRTDDFDCVVIIRGGGSTTDLSGFDTLALAENVAQFPLPVITGIGHERDESVIDLIANTSVKTPTAAAAFLIERLKRVLDFLTDREQRIASAASRRMQTEQVRLMHAAQTIPTLFSLYASRQTARLDTMQGRMTSAASQTVTRQQARLDSADALLPTLMRHITDAQRHRLQLLSQRAQALDPAILLSRGYTITLHDGRAVRSAKDLHPGDLITTRLADGEVTSVIGGTE